MGKRIRVVRILYKNLTDEDGEQLLRQYECFEDFPATLLDTGFFRLNLASGKTRFINASEVLFLEADE